MSDRWTPSRSVDERSDGAKDCAVRKCADIETPTTEFRARPLVKILNERGEASAPTPGHGDCKIRVPPTTPATNPAGRGDARAAPQGACKRTRLRASCEAGCEEPRCRPPRTQVPVRGGWPLP